MMCIGNDIGYVRPVANCYNYLTNPLLHTLYYLCYHNLQCNNKQQKLQNMRNNCKLSEINENTFILC